MKNYNKTIKNLFLSAVAVSTLASCQKDFYLEDLEDSQKIVASLEFTNETLTAEIAQLELSVDAANYTINQNEIAIAGLEGDNVALTIENDILKAIIEGLEASIYVLEELLKEKDDAILVLDSSSTTYQTDITNITAEKDALLVQMNNHSAELADAIAQIYALKELILVQANEINSLEAENAALRAQIAAFQTELAGAGAGVGESTEALAEAEAALVVANDEIVSLSTTVSVTERAVTNLRTLLTAALADLENAGNSDTASTTALITELRASIQTKDAYISALEGRIEMADDYADELLRDVNRLTYARDMAVRNLDLLQGEIDAFLGTLLLSPTGSSAVVDGFELGYNSTPQWNIQGITNQVYVSTINTTNNTVTMRFSRLAQGYTTTITFLNAFDAALFYASNGEGSEMLKASEITTQFAGATISGDRVNDDRTIN